MIPKISCGWLRHPPGCTRKPFEIIWHHEIKKSINGFRNHSRSPTEMLNSVWLVTRRRCSAGMLGLAGHELWPDWVAFWVPEVGPVVFHFEDSKQARFGSCWIDEHHDHYMMFKGDTSINTLPPNVLHNPSPVNPGGTYLVFAIQNHWKALMAKFQVSRWFKMPKFW